MPRDQILNLVRRLSKRNGRAALVRYAAEYYDTPIETGDVPLLTDDYAPVDALLPIYWRSPVPP
jgi:hypothetical protein